MKKQIQLKGFTLIELLVVVLIIGILTSIAVPQYQKSVAKARYVEIQTLVEQLNDAEEMYAQEYGYYTNDFTKLKDFSVPGWTPSKTSLEGRTRDVATYLRKNDEKAELSLDTLLAGAGGRAITGTIFSGKHSNGNAIWANRYVLYSPHGGWRENQRECRARASDADKNKPKNTNNHVCDSVGGIRCQWNSSNGNIFIIETLTALKDGGSTSTVLNNICAPYKNSGGITTGYYKANKTWYQTYVGPQ